MQNDKEAFYSQRILKYSHEVELLNKKISIISVLRFFVFVLAAASIWYFALHNADYIIYDILLAIIAFIFLVRKHEILIQLKAYYQQLININKEEKLSLIGNWSPFNGGKEFLSKADLHSEDLDVFGEKSLFQKINRTGTLSGKNRLAVWFRFPNRRAIDILEKQEVIKELKDEVDFRQHFRATALMEIEHPGDYVKMIRWMNEKAFFSNHIHFKILAYLIPIINISFTLAWAVHLLPYYFAVNSILFTLAFLAFYQKIIIAKHNVLSRRAKLILKYVKLLRSIEDRSFKSLLLNQLQKEMSGDQKKAYEHISDLVKNLQALDQRLNMLVGILLNVYLVWDIRHLVKIENWKKENAEEMIIWFNNIGIMDAYCSLANVAFNESEWIFPALSDDKLLIGKNLRHPLMDYKSCVPNDIEILKQPHFKIITGANMAGKSTYLRTVGANLLLAMTGSVVNATAFEFVPTKLATSLRTSDSLMKNESYFYAELKRLQTIIQLIEKGENVFVLLDEILKGTNSKDKELGSIALLEQLIKLKAYGIIATHDLNLAKISESFSDNTENLRFEAEITNDLLIFDYKIKPGVAQNLNATFLMKKMGITF